MDVGKAEASFIDILAHREDSVITNKDGWGEFSVNAGSVSVWVEASYLSSGSADVSVTFICQNGETVWGQNVYALGNIAELGNWDPDKAKKLSPTDYPAWNKIITPMPANTRIEWKCIKKDGAGNVEWQTGPNNACTTPDSGQGETIGSF
jgi:hypothetical protein